MVGEEDESLLLFGIVIADPPESVGIISASIKAMEFDDLIGLNTFGFGGLLRIETPEAKISFGADDEEGSGLMDLVEACKIQIASIEKVNSSRFDEEFVEDLELVDFAMSNEDQCGNAAAQIHQRMEFDRSFALAEMSPRKERQTKIDGGRIEGINRLFQFDTKVFVGI